ncbi:DNA polymerase III subunit beta [Deinococcus sp. Leaf326]|uniref:DNA polymerase III subunit beta n=1 Tax=Deinococcus sp. Leaf326 TaxID=1736338 RepID=UPI0006FAF27E|nr:DNA polymerase III subunit beta [Deinococcus sp. Leaf326]KQR25581.1 DNA polymerase III subunit beta [Deinococcus sp. Leaf326]
MRVQITKRTLSEALGLLERVIPTRSTNPLLTMLRMDASETGLTLSGTNLEVDLACFAPAEVHHPQSLVVPAHLFAQVVRNMNGELIELALEGKELTVRAEGSDVKLQIGDVEAYPPLTFPQVADATVDAAALSKALGSVRYAASNEAFQAVFRGVKLEQHAAFARVVASDGYRVALYDFPSTGEGQTLIIPARSVDELVRVLRDGEARFTYGDGQLSVTTTRVRMNLKLLDGAFPDYDRVIPKEIKLQVRLPAALLKEAVGRVSVLADRGANNRIEFLIGEGKLRLAAEGDYGRAQDLLDVVQSGTVGTMRLAFNARHVLDALTAIEGDVELLFSGPTSPAIFQPVDQSGYRSVMVTLRV